MYAIFLIIVVLVSFGGGWFCKGAYGAKAAAVKDAVEKVV